MKDASTTRMNELVKIKLLREVYLPAALKLEEKENWNQTARDWKRLLTLSPDGCFGAFCGGELIGTVTVMTYRQDLAWIGMMIVAQEYRGRGVGKQLMLAALDYCKSRNIAAAKLDATPAGRPLYQSLGFLPEFPLERWQGAGLLTTLATSEWSADNEVRMLLHLLDGRAFYVPRTDLLNSLLDDCCVEPALQFGGSRRELQGYALARRGARAVYIGPVVAIEPSVAIILLDSLLQRLAGAVFLDVRITTDIADSLVERGFAKQRGLTRMSFGKKMTAGSELVFAIAGPELG